MSAIAGDDRNARFSIPAAGCDNNPAWAQWILTARLLATAKVGPGLVGLRLVKSGSSVLRDLMNRQLETLAPGHVMVPFDDSTFLTVVPKGLRAAEFDAVLIGIATVLNGSMPQDGSSGLSIWRPIAFDGADIQCEAIPLSSPTSSTGTAQVGGEVKPAIGEGPSVAVLPDADFVFLPIWAVRWHRIYAYLCEPTWQLAENKIVHEDRIRGEFDHFRMRSALDFESLQRGLKAVDELLEHDRPVTIIVPLHADILLDQSQREAYLQLCQHHIGSFREMIGFEIRFHADNFDQAAYNFTAKLLRPYCRDIWARVPTGTSELGIFANGDTAGLIFDYQETDRPEAELMTEFESVVRAASAIGFGTCALGLSTRSLTVGAICAGFDMIASDVIARELSHIPRDSHWVTPVDLFKELKIEQH